MGIAAFKRFHDGTELDFCATRSAPDNVHYYGLKVFETDRATNVAHSYEVLEPTLKAGFKLQLSEKISYYLALTTIPVNNTAASRLDVEAAYHHASMPVPQPQKGTYTFDGVNPLWAWILEPLGAQP